ncbi:MAG TPA: chromosome segregation protein SMC [Acidimicrobiia bacterium]|nr:chromosome segregation protein SMC [Acidimicrobiia bacterium]
MFLKALTLKGFKSFAEKTELSFESGVTVVVGPNGSGKSNLVDAVAWVLGAQGARALRGAKMDDVIFAGTTKKPALGRAEVSLTIDNADGTLPIEFTEVTITRTLFRSGESEYRLNDVPCRLLDIQELLSDSRIGRTQHVIVGQGQLDSVLNARPEDRRAIIEEAAGVLKYRKRREKAQRRLESTEGNLIRLGDLVREVRRQLSPLQRQADAARRHDGVRDELTAIRLFLTGKEIRGHRAALERISEERIASKEREQTLLSELSALDISVLDAEAALMKVGDSDVAGWLSRAERLVARTGATKAMLGERRRSIAMQLDSSADESVIESLLSEKEQLDRAIIELTTSLDALVPAISAQRSEHETFTARYAEFMKSAPSDDVVRDYETLVKEQKIYEDNLAVLRDRLDIDIARLETIRQRVSILQQDNNDANEVLTSEAQYLADLGREREILLANLDGVRSEIEQTQSEHKALQAQAAGKKAHYDILLETFNAHASMAGIEHVRAQTGVLGTLMEKISIDERALEAVSVVLEDLASAILVDSPENAKQTAATLSAKDARARLFVLESHASHAAPVIPEGAQALTGFISSDDSRVTQALDRILSHVVFVDGDWKTACDVAIAHPDLVVVTPGGDRFGGSRSWSLGKTTTRTVTAESVEAAGRDADNAARAEQDCATAFESLLARRDDDETRERELSTSIHEITSRHSIAQQTANATQSGMTARMAEATSLETEITELRELITSDETAIEELTSRSLDLRDQKDNAEGRQEDFAVRKQEHDKAGSELENEIRRLEIEQELTQTRLKDARTRLGNVNDRLAKDPEQERAAMARREVHLTMMTHIDELIARTSAVEEGALRAREVFSQERQKQTDEAHESTSRLETLRITRREAESALVGVRGAMQKGDITEAETKTRLTGIIESLRANFDCEPDAALDAPMPEVDEGITLSGRARDLERDLKLMGPINPLAVQEYDELNERHVFLNQQLDDVKASRKELHKVIKTIDHEIVSVFEKAFEDVQKHFSDLFSTLFSGGSGRLTLSDPNDMLNTGIEMEARPSGKNVRRLSLLSGGERSLTALAFLFAVFRSRPSPFYIMDEVEAALDEPNLVRFLDLVGEFRHDAQLLIVSHQKKTMEAADELYGVSMAPAGSSRAIKQRIEKPVKSEAPGQVVLDLAATAAREKEFQDNETSDMDDAVLESSI